MNHLGYLKIVNFLYAGYALWVCFVQAKIAAVLSGKIPS